MRNSSLRRVAGFAVGMTALTLSLNAQKQANQADVPAPAIGVRATPGDYQDHAQVGPITIGAEFMGHAVPTPEATFNTDDFVVVEVGFLGQQGTPIQLSPADFSLRINGKKNPIPGEPYSELFGSLKDPEWEATLPTPTKSKGSVGSGGGGQDDSLPRIVHMPVEVLRVMQLRVQKASLAEGNRELPQAGLIYFPYHGAVKGIHSIELFYSGSAGRANLMLHP